MLPPGSGVISEERGMLFCVDSTTAEIPGEMKAIMRVLATDDNEDVQNRVPFPGPGGMHFFSDSKAESKKVTLSGGMNIKKKVLVIDDDEDFGLALTIFFSDKPFRLFLAHTLLEGMVMLEKERPEHVFLDNRLPDGLGWDKAEFIMTQYPKVRLNLISALRPSRPSVAVHRIFQKPISLEDMLSCLV